MRSTSCLWHTVLSWQQQHWSVTMAKTSRVDNRYPLGVGSIVFLWQTVLSWQQQQWSVTKAKTSRVDNRYPLGIGSIVFLWHTLLILTKMTVDEQGPRHEWWSTDAVRDMVHPLALAYKYGTGKTTDNKQGLWIRLQGWAANHACFLGRESTLSSDRHTYSTKLTVKHGSNQWTRIGASEVICKWCSLGLSPNSPASPSPGLQHNPDINHH